MKSFVFAQTSRITGFVLYSFLSPFAVVPKIFLVKAYNANNSTSQRVGIAKWARKRTRRSEQSWQCECVWLPLIITGYRSEERIACSWAKANDFGAMVHLCHCPSLQLIQQSTKPSSRLLIAMPKLSRTKNWSYKNADIFVFNIWDLWSSSKTENWPCPLSFQS